MLSPKRHCQNFGKIFRNLGFVWMRCGPLYGCLLWMVSTKSNNNVHGLLSFYFFFFKIGRKWPKMSMVSGFLFFFYPLSCVSGPKFGPKIPNRKMANFWKFGLNVVTEETLPKLWQDFPKFRNPYGCGVAPCMDAFYGWFRQKVTIMSMVCFHFIFFFFKIGRKWPKMSMVSGFLFFFYPLSCVSGPKFGPKIQNRKMANF